MSSKQYSKGYKDDVLRYLDRYITTINGPMDIIKIFSKMENGQRHLWLALRVLFNYLEVMGSNIEYLNMLRKALPKVRCGLDLKIPTENEMLESIQKLNRTPMKYQTLYRLLLDSGLRLIEAVKIINEFEPGNVETINGFHRIPIGQFRGSKQCYYAYFTEPTFKMLNASPQEPINAIASSRYFRKMGFISPKYLRKFCFDKMIELEIPESIADFIEGRVARKIGARHYMSLSRQSNKFYGRYAEYIGKLYRKLS